MKEKIIQKILRCCIPDCDVHVETKHDDELDFTSYFVIVRTKCCFHLRCIHDFSKCMKEKYNLDCCDFHFDLGSSQFYFELF